MPDSIQRKRVGARRPPPHLRASLLAVLTLAAAPAVAEPLAERPDDRPLRLDALLEEPEERAEDEDAIVNAVAVEFGLEAETLYRRDLERTPRRRLEASESQNEFSFGFEARLLRRIELAAEVKGVWELDWTSDSADAHSRGLVERGESWIRLTDLFGLGLSASVGRIEWRDDREWWWDEDLDTVLLRLRRGGVSLEVGGGRQIGPETTRETSTPADRADVWRIAARAAWRAAPWARLEAFLLHELDVSEAESPGDATRATRLDPEDRRLTWLGLRASGARKRDGAGRLDYWLGAAVSFGRATLVSYGDEPIPGTTLLEAERVGRVSAFGYAADAGLTWTWPVRLGPRLTAAFAYGSGGSVRDGEVRRVGFRQSGLQSNEAAFGEGVRRFRYYGELLDPELSNLGIVTAGVGANPLRNASADVVFHAYWQDAAAPLLAEALLEAEPKGRARYLGEGLDLILGYRIRDLLEWKLAVSAFRAGGAFGREEGRWAWGAGTEIEFAWEPELPWNPERPR